MTFYGRLLDLLFPPCCPGCGRSVRTVPSSGLCADCRGRVIFTFSGCRNCGRPLPAGRLICDDPACSVEVPPFDWWRSSTAFSGPVREMIHRFKYSGMKKLAYPLACLLDEYVKRRNVELSGIELIVPVPVSEARLKSRGYNQAGLLAAEFGRLRGLDCLFGAVGRDDGRPQVGLNSEMRRANVRGQFEVLEPGLVKGRALLLIDDVVTTGSTLRELASTLSAAGAGRLCALCLAHGL